MFTATFDMNNSRRSHHSSAHYVTLPARVPFPSPNPPSTSNFAQHRSLLHIISLVPFPTQGRSTPMSDHSLTINPGADVSDPRQKHRVDAAPTPSSARYPPLYPPPDDQDEPALDGGPALNQAGQEQMQQQQQQQHYHGEDDVGMDEVDAYAAEVRALYVCVLLGI